jgi:HSP20 family protein
MKLIPWRARPDEADAIARLRSEVDRLFGEAFMIPFGALEAKPGMREGQRNGGWFPALDVSETDKEITLRMEVPGIEPKALDISITGNVLTITGEKKEESERKGEDYYHRERRFGSFRRSIELPEAVDAERISAECADGIAVIHVPRKPGAKPRQVEVRQTAAKA